MATQKITRPQMIVSAEAAKVASVIDGLIDAVLAKHDIIRVVDPGDTAIQVTIAQLVQLAINQAIAKRNN